MDNLKIIGTGKEVFSAFFSAKGELKTSIKPDKQNPHFKSDYITLDSLLKKVDPVCQKYGIGIMQFPTGIGLVTLIFHEKSGEYISSYYELVLDKKNAQGVGSALTYAKRQTIQALFGLSAGPEEDDDGHEASQEDKQFEEENPVQGKVDNANAYQIAKVALQEINSLEGLEIWKDAQPPIIKRNRSVRELVNAKMSELKLAV
jgi:hypothetical protein